MHVISKVMPEHDEIYSAWLPHRPPWDLLSRIVDWDGIKILAEMYVSPELPFLTGHFPDRPVTPGVVILEGLTHAGAMLVFLNHPERKDSGVALAKVEKVLFKEALFPPVLATLLVTLKREGRGLYFFEGTVRVDQKVVATAEFVGGAVNWKDR